MGQMETRHRDELALGADPLEEHDHLEREEDDRVNARPAPLGVQLPCPPTHEGEVELASRCR